MPTNRQRYAFFGHHKCATTWVIAIATAVSERLNLNFVNVSNTEQFNGQLAKFVTDNQINFLSYSNAVAKQIIGLENYKGFHIIRDPRDIVVSAYFSHLHSHSTEGWNDLIDHRQYLQNVSPAQGLLREMEQTRWEFEELNNWDYHQSNILEIKMEELIHQPYDTMVNAFSFLGLVEETLFQKSSTLGKELTNRLHQKSRGLFPFHFQPDKISIPDLLGILYHHRFSAKAEGRKPGQENIKSHYRKGVAGDWVNHFTPEHRQYFKQHYNELLLKLGYETTADW